MRPGPAQAVATARSMKEVDSLEARGQKLVAAVTVPVHDAEAVHDGQAIVDQVRLPSGAVFLSGSGVSTQQHFRLAIPG